MGESIRKLDEEKSRYMEKKFFFLSLLFAIWFTFSGSGRLWIVYMSVSVCLCVCEWQPFVDLFGADILIARLVFSSAHQNGSSRVIILLPKHSHSYIESNINPVRIYIYSVSI